MAKTKVLIVEDEAIIAKDIENVLTKAGYKVVGSFLQEKLQYKLLMSYILILF